MCGTLIRWKSSAFHKVVQCCLSGVMDKFIIISLECLQDSAYHKSSNLADFWLSCSEYENAVTFWNSMCLVCACIFACLHMCVCFCLSLCVSRPALLTAVDKRACLWIEDLLSVCLSVCVCVCVSRPAQLTTVGKRACLWIEDLLSVCLSVCVCVCMCV